MTYLITKFPQVFLTQLYNISKQVFAFSSTIYIFIFIFNVNCPCFMYFTIIEQTFQWHYFHSCVNKVHIVSIKLDYSFCFSLKNGNVYYFEFHVKSYKGLTDVSVMVRRHYFNNYTDNDFCVMTVEITITHRVWNCFSLLYSSGSQMLAN